MLFQQYKCPKCGKSWGKGNVEYRHSCGYELRVIGCPQCMNVITSEEVLTKKRNAYINNASIKKDECSCLCNYIELDMTVMDYIHRYYADMDSLFNDLPAKYSRFFRECAQFPLQKYLYDNFFDHSKINHSHPDIIRFFAFLNPETEESKQYFLKEYGESYDELYQKTHNERELQKLKELSAQKKEAAAQQRVAIQESLHPTPKCPICGSTRLTKISAITKAAKISAFGIYGAGDIGKTFKCNNCGGKF